MTAINALAEALEKAVRPLVTIMFAGALIVAVFRRIISGAEFVAVIGPIMAWWFAQRAAQKAEERQAAAVAAVAVAAADQAAGKVASRP